EAAGKFKEALDLFATLPKAIKENHTVQCTRRDCAKKVGPTEAKEAWDDIIRLFADEPDMSLIVFGARLGRKEFAEAQACLDQLEKRIGGPDAFLDYQRAEVARLAGKPLSEQKDFAKKACQGEPTLAKPYWFLVVCSLDEKDYAETSRLLTHIEKKL